jgi:hypothetical protein
MYFLLRFSAIQDNAMHFVLGCLTTWDLVLLLNSIQAAQAGRLFLSQACDIAPGPASVVPGRRPCMGCLWRLKCPEQQQTCWLERCSWH